MLWCYGCEKEVNDLYDDEAIRQLQLRGVVLPQQVRNSFIPQAVSAESAFNSTQEREMPSLLVSTRFGLACWYNL